MSKNELDILWSSGMADYEMENFSAAEEKFRRGYEIEKSSRFRLVLASSIVKQDRKDEAWGILMSNVLKD